MPIKNLRPAGGDWENDPLLPAPLFLKPELLSHPQIPKPLHGLNPRTVKGDRWWNVVRQWAYAKNNFCCWACGRHKSIVLQGWLEAHEHYRIDYELGRAEMIEIVALCNECHNFIHQGRLSSILDSLAAAKDFDGARKHGEYIARVMAHGTAVLQRAGMHPAWMNVRKMRLLAIQLGLQDASWGRQADLWADSEAYRDHFASQSLKEAHEPLWGDWRLIIEGIEYKPPHNSYEEWLAFYTKKNQEVRS